MQKWSKNLEFRICSFCVKLRRLVVVLCFTRTCSTATRRRRHMARPKQRIGIDREGRSMKKVKTWPNGSDSGGTSSQAGDEPSTESSGHPETWLEDAMQQAGVEDGKDEALSAETIIPPNPPEEEDCVVLKTVPSCPTFQHTISQAGSKTGHLVTTKVTRSGSVRGLPDGPVESAPAPRNGSGGQEGSDSDAAARGFDCTTCGQKCFSMWDIQEHPQLRVGICRDCWDFLFSSPYTKSAEDGSEEQCLWCGEGGKIVMCDDCDKVFCRACIVRNFGPKSLAEIVNSDHWSCFSCKPEHLRVQISEFQKFKKSVSAADRDPAKRKGASPAGKSRTTRNSTNFPGTANGEGATIAEILAQEEERRRQNPEQYAKPKRKRKPVQKPSSAPLKDPGNKNKAGAYASFPNQIRTRRHASQSNETIADIVQRATAPPTPAYISYIRPHQWLEKRQQAAERRKRAEADRLKNDGRNLPNGGLNLPNDGLNLPNNGTPNHANTQAVSDSRVQQSHSNEEKQAHRRSEHTGKLLNEYNGMTSELHSPDEGNEVERSNRDMMQAFEDVLGNTAKNLFPIFT